MRTLLLALLLTTCTASADEWTARPDGLYNPDGDKVQEAIKGAFDRSDFSRKERNALIFAVIATGLDIATTREGIDKGGCVEANPFLGKNPSTGKLVALGAAQMGGAYYFMQKDQEDYSKLGWVTGGAHLLAAGWNASRDCKPKGRER